MSAPKHTPGPWSPDSDGNVIAADPSVVVAIVYRNSIQTTKEEEGANARLIASAPDLLAALGPDNAGRDFADLLTDAADVLRAAGGGPIEDCLRAKADEVRAALAKARGL